MKKISYRICPRHPENHLLEVSCSISHPNKEGQIFSLPVWIPGSYLIRDFSRHVQDLKAVVNGKPVAIRMLNKHTWQCAAMEEWSQDQQPLILSYQIYANDLTPRGAHVDTLHAFFNGSRVFMQIQGQEDIPCEVELIKPEDPKYHKWRVATSLKPMLNTQDNYAFTRFQAKNYDDLIDHPVEMGHFEVTTFRVKEVLHELIITHTAAKDIEKLDRSRLTTDLEKIAKHHIDFFGEASEKERFLFLLTVFKGGQGGIEHKSSCVMHTSYEEMPKIEWVKQAQRALAVTTATNYLASTQYQNLLSLLSHEYFHAWHVKRIKPKAFDPYDLTQENYTRLLWLFEGVTSYYDELSLLRAGLISLQSYLDALTTLINGVYSTPGRKKQTLEASSFDAWIKLYKPDENSRNTTINYYSKGALVGLCLDLLLRRETRQECSLDDIMRALWMQYGREEKGLPEDAFEALVKNMSGVDLTAFFEKALRSTEDLPLEELLNSLGILITWQPVKPMLNLGARMNLNYLESVELLEVLSDSALEKAGLMARDRIIAINHHKVHQNSIETILAEYSEGESLEIHYFRRDELFSSMVMVEPGDIKMAVLQVTPTPSEQQKNALEAWIKTSSGMG